MSRNTLPDLSIIVPVHNEEQVIQKVVHDIHHYLSKTTISYEVLCIENGSTDKSFEVLKKLIKVYKNYYLYTSEKGWGKAVAKGIRHAKGKYICYTVSDNQIDPAIIPKMYRLASTKKNVLVKTKRITRENLIRKINSNFYNNLAFILFNIRYRDINGTPKILPSDVISSVSFISPNVSFDLELLLKIRGKIKIIEIPITSRKRSTGVSSTTIKNIFEMLKYMIIFRFRPFH